MRESPLPVLFVDGSPNSIAVCHDLASKLGFSVIEGVEPEQALTTLRAAADRFRPVALCLVEQATRLSGAQLRQLFSWFPEARHVHLSTIPLASSPETVPHTHPPELAPDRLREALSEHLRDWQSAYPNPHRARLVGDISDPRNFEPRDALVRGGADYEWIDADSDTGRRLLSAAKLLLSRELTPPLLIIPGTGAFEHPSARDVEREALGALRTAQGFPQQQDYDLIILGGGPAGLAASIYAGARGWKTLLVAEQLGGSAATAPQIRNYPGFPRGVNGAELMRSFREQAEGFGQDRVRTWVGRRIAGLVFESRPGVRLVGEPTPRFGKALLLATGLIPNRLPASTNVESFLNKGVFYNTPPSEMAQCRGKRVYLIGAGNAAGEGAVEMARLGAERVTLVVRGAGLEAMSAYLHHELEEHRDRIQVAYRTEVAVAEGATRLERLTLKLRGEGNEERRETVAADQLYICTGGSPNTEFLAGCGVALEKGYVKTGRWLQAEDAYAAAAAAANAHHAQTGRWPQPGELDSVMRKDRQPLPLETSRPGVFAAGDVRLGSQKYVAAAVGEGTTAVEEISAYVRPV